MEPKSSFNLKTQCQNLEIVLNFDATKSVVD